MILAGIHINIYIYIQYIYIYNIYIYTYIYTYIYYQPIDTIPTMVVMNTCDGVRPLFGLQWHSSTVDPMGIHGALVGPWRRFTAQAELAEVRAKIFELCDLPVINSG